MAKRPNLLGLNEQEKLNIEGLSAKDFSDLRKMLGNIAAPATEAPAEAQQPIPIQFDWRNVHQQNFVTPVRNQRFCGACIAFAVTSAMETQARIIENIPLDSENSSSLPDLSAAQLFYCGLEGNFKCLRGWGIKKALHFASRSGVIPDVDYPYPMRPYLHNAGQPTYDSSKLTTIHKTVELETQEDIKSWIANKGPVITSFSIYLDFFFYRSGVYKPSKQLWNIYLGEHSVVCIGYDEEQQAWIAKNSWGEAWGDKGFFRIAYHQCGFNSLAWGIESFKSIYQLKQPERVNYGG